MRVRVAMAVTVPGNPVTGFDIAGFKGVLTTPAGAVDTAPDSVLSPSPA
jgi:hypothetical protein